MDGAPALSLLLAANGLQGLLVVLVVLAVVVVLLILGALFMLSRRRTPEEASVTLESTAPPPPPVPAAPAASAGPGQVPVSADQGDAFGQRPPAPPPVDGPGASPPPAPVVQARGGVPDPPAEPPAEAGAAPSAAPPHRAEEPASAAPAPAPISPTQTPDDVDQRSPAELAAAARAAEAGEAREAAGDNGAGPAGTIQHERAIGPPRPLPLAQTAPPDPARLRMLGLTLGILSERMRREHPPQLGTALARLVDSDQEAARSQLSTLALSLLGEDQEPSGDDSQLGLFLEEALQGEVRRGFSFSSMPEFQQALTAVAPALREKLQTIVWARNADSVAVLTTEDVEALERVSVAMATALMIDTSYDLRRHSDEPAPGRA